MGGDITWKDDLNLANFYTDKWMKDNSRFVDRDKLDKLDKLHNQRIRGMNITRIEYSSMATIDELIMAESYMELVVERIKSKGYEVPTTLSKTLEDCSKDLKCKLKNKREQDLYKLKQERETLLSNEEKIINIDKKIDELIKLLS